MCRLNTVEFRFVMYYVCMYTDMPFYAILTRVTIDYAVRKLSYIPGQNYYVDVDSIVSDH